MSTDRGNSATPPQKPGSAGERKPISPQLLSEENLEVDRQYSDPAINPLGPSPSIPPIKVAPIKRATSPSVLAPIPPKDEKPVSPVLEGRPYQKVKTTNLSSLVGSSLR